MREREKKERDQNVALASICCEPSLKFPTMVICVPAGHPALLISFMLSPIVGASIDA